MYKIRLMFAVLIFYTVMAQAQDDQAAKEAQKALRASTDLTWDANKELTANDFPTAESDYRRAISKSSENTVAPFNLGTAYYNRESYGEAFGRFKQTGEKTKEKPQKHKAYHNLGNVLMKKKDYQQAVDAYKQALRSNPNDDETRYNLALAKKMLEKQQNEQNNQNQDDKDQQDQQDQKDQNQDQNNEGDKEKENEGEQNEDENKDKGDEGDNGENKPEENKEGDGDEKKEQEKKPKEGDQPEEQKQQPRPNQLSKQQIQNLLEAMQNEEKKVQEKMEARKVRGKKVKNEKDW
ncbi:tetratricopeptide repeat protein [Flagellimonas sp.]|uniref:tetratricopeptide repeat protein n=1 Tax=Flagellimonas sp. TaxID=2058762 RepID=UPI003B4FFC60